MTRYSNSLESINTSPDAIRGRVVETLRHVQLIDERGYLRTGDQQHLIAGIAANVLSRCGIAHSVSALQPRPRESVRGYSQRILADLV